jgi:hypothetical protein
VFPARDRGRAGLVEVTTDQGVESWWHLDGNSVEGGRDPTVVFAGHLVGAHRDDRFEGLCEQEGEQAADARVERDRLVVEQAVDLLPAVGVGDDDFRGRFLVPRDVHARVRVRRSQVTKDCSLVRPAGYSAR